MDTLNLDLGTKRLAINGDPERVISFNPNDVSFAERFYQVMQEFEAKQAEFTRRSGELSADDARENIALMREACDFMGAQVDSLFGPGTTQTVFGDVRSLDGFAQFFEGITPFIQAARSEKIARYTQRPQGKVMR